MAARHFSSNPTLKKKIVQKNGQEFVIDIFARWFIFCYREKKKRISSTCQIPAFPEPINHGMLTEAQGGEGSEWEAGGSNCESQGRCRFSLLPSLKLTCSAPWKCMLWRSDPFDSWGAKGVFSGWYFLGSGSEPGYLAAHRSRVIGAHSTISHMKGWFTL